MKILAIGNIPDDVSKIGDFGGVLGYYLRREFLARGIDFRSVPRGDFSAFDPGEADHVIAFGSRFFSRAPENVAWRLSRQIKGAVCQFHDSPMRDGRTDITFACKGAPDARNVIISWAADPEICKPAQNKRALKILVDHPDYVNGRGDVSDRVVAQLARLRKSSLLDGGYNSVSVEVLSSPKGSPAARVPFPEMCAKYGTAHLFMVTHPEGVGLSVIEAAMSGALPIVPHGFMDAGLLSTIRHIGYTGDISWPFVLSKINPGASRDRALSQSWGAVADKIVKALTEFRK